MMREKLLGLTYVLACVLPSTLLLASTDLAQTDSGSSIRVGMIGLDTSHCIEFTKIFNDPSNPLHVPGIRVVAAFKGGSPDIDASRNRVETFTAELQDKWMIKIVDDIPTLVGMVDAVLLESLDGRAHLDQVKPVLAAGKPVFIDKPLADSYHDATEIAAVGQASWCALVQFFITPLLGRNSSP